MLLEGAGLKRVSVSTVHRAQGSERHTVIFDPVDGNNKFLQTEDARRLVNVALSRAQARLVVVLSAGDRQNPLFEQIATVIERRGAVQVATTGNELTPFFNFPADALGQTIRINSTIGEVVELIQAGKKFRLRDFQTGEIKTFVTEFVRSKVTRVSVSPTTNHSSPRERSFSPSESRPDRSAREIPLQPEPAKVSSLPVNSVLLPPNTVLLAIMDDETWFELARWAKIHGHLTPWDRSFCYSQGKRATKGDLPSEKQADVCKRILNEAAVLGFEFVALDRKRR